MHSDATGDNKTNCRVLFREGGGGGGAIHWGLIVPQYQGRIQGGVGRDMYIPPPSSDSVTLCQQ